MTNVVGYRSFANAPLLSTFIGSRVPPDMLFKLASLFFVVALVAGSWLTRRLPLTKAYLVYLVVVAVLAPAIANRYFEIPLAAAAAFPNAHFVVWMAAATLFLIGDGDGLHSSAVLEALPDLLRKDQISHSAYRTITWLLAAGGALWWWRSRGSASVAAGVPSDGFD